MSNSSRLIYIYDYNIFSMTYLYKEEKIKKSPDGKIVLLKACVQGTYGKECNSKCGNCLNTDGCDHINGSCITGCAPGYVGDLCKTRK